MSEPTSTPAQLPKFDVERFIHLSRQVVTVGVREEVRVYQLVTGPHGRSRAVLRAALASLLAHSPEEWRQVATCFEESFAVESAPTSRWQIMRHGLLSRLGNLRPAVRTALLMMVALGCVGGAVYRFWPKPPAVEQSVDSPQPPTPLPPPPTTETVRIVEDQPAKTIEERQNVSVPIPKQPWVVVCALMSMLCALGIRWLLLPRTLRRWQMHSQRDAEAALAKEAREKGQLLRPSYRVEPILPIARNTVEDCATLLGRLLDKERGEELDVLQTMDATIRAGGRFTAMMQPRRASGEVLVLVDEEERDHPWLSTLMALLELWRRQGVRLAVYTYGNPFPHYLDPHPRRPHESIGLPEVAREHAGAALLILSRRLSVEGFAGEADWTKELEPFPQRVWIDPDPRPVRELPEGRAPSIEALASHRLVRFPLTNEGVAAAVRQLVSEHETASSPVWPELSRCQNENEQRALRLWATAAALVPDATWDQVLALRAGLAEVSEVFPPPDVRPIQRLLEWVKTESGENPEKQVDRLFLSPEFQDRLVTKLRQEDGGPTREGGFERRVHQILLGQLGEAPRAAEQQIGRGRLVWELKVAMHHALLAPKRAKELLGRFMGTGVESLLGVYLRGERERQKGAQVFSEGTWANLGVMTSQEGRITPSQLVIGNARLWMGSALAGLGIGMLLCMPVLFRIPKLSELLQPKAEKVVEREQPGESHVERVKPLVAKTEEPSPGTPAVPEKPPKVVETPQRPSLVWIEPGTFQMGSPESDPDHEIDEKRHPVKITKGYYLMESEVTQGQYQAVMGESPVVVRRESGGTSCKRYGAGSKLPVHCVDFYDAVKFANTLSVKEGLEKCYVVRGESVSWPKKQGCSGYRLPTEVEWEYAAKAGKTHKYVGGDSLDAYAWYAGNSEDRVHAVKTRKPNGLGLYDLSGNVWEWVWDWHTEHPESLPRTDPIGPGDGSYRVVRGGSWYDVARYARVAYRSSGQPGNRFAYQGFRLARSYP